MIVPVHRLLLSAAVVVALAAPAGAGAARPALPAFGSCQGLMSYARAAVRRTGGGTGVPTRAFGGAPAALPSISPVGRPMEGTVTGGPQPSTVAAPQADAKAGEDFSGTTTQEAGVDEADVVKTDGRRLFVVQEGVLRILDLTGEAPREVGKLGLPGYGHQLLLRGDRLLVIAQGNGGGPIGVARAAMVAVPYTQGKTVLTEVDVSDPAAPKVARTMDLDGAIVAGRLTGGTARVVVASAPQAVPAPENTTLRTFVPRTTIRSRISGHTFRRGVVACDDVRHPRAFSGLDLLTVLTIDLDKGLFDVDRDAVMAGAETVYASPDALYVASRRWSPALDERGAAVPGDLRTELHKFDASKPGETTYRASGSVPGFVLDQFSLGEHAGRLQVATTEEPQWFGGDVAQRDSESGVSVLEEHDGRLVQVGRVGGLGKSERIYSVRFAGDVGYVVTFRQIDPLYTLDLSDPTAPRLRGELKVLGYSSYLHPIGEGLLLGIGQDATAEGRRAGTQLSLFDVSDLARPRKLAGVALGTGTQSDAEDDHHAFLYWDKTKLAVVPIVRYAYDEAEEPYAGAVGFRIDKAAGITEVGRVSHVAKDAIVPIGRSIVLGDRLLTVSAAGVATNRLSDLAPLAAMTFAG